MGLGLLDASELGLWAMLDYGPTENNTRISQTQTLFLKTLE
jgi:hypothetical protein